MPGLDLGPLAVLAVVGYAISAIATVWSLTQTTTRETGGTRQLTFAGHVSIGLAIAAFLVATASLMVEKLNEQKKESLAQQKETERTLLEAAREARAEQRSYELSRKLDVGEARRSLEEAEQRLITLGLAAEERQRDLESAERERRNADRVTMALWREANRVRANSIMASISTRCSTRSKLAAFPAVIPVGSRAELEIDKSSQRDPSARVVLASSDQRFSQRRDDRGNSVQYRQFNTFTGFVSDIGPFGILQQWAGAKVRLSVEVQTADAVAEIFRDLVPAGREPGGRTIAQGLEAVRIPCSTSFALAVNDRLVARARGTIYEIVEPGSGMQGRVFAEFEPATISSQAIPQLPAD